MLFIYPPCLSNVFVHGAFESVEAFLRICELKRVGDHSDLAMFHLNQEARGTIGSFFICHCYAIPIPMTRQPVDTDTAVPALR